jgi:hypothetical protein
MQHSATALELARQFWELMATNDFTRPARLFSEGFVLDWPQTNERIRGRENFSRLNAEYPAHGPWRFELEALVGDAHTAVSRVRVTDGVQSALAISFFEVSGGCIDQITEFWPDTYTPPSNRAHLTEPLKA